MGTVFARALGGHHRSMHFCPDLADFRVLGVGDSLDQIVDSVEKLFELRTEAGVRAANIISGDRSREGGVHDNSLAGHPLVFGRLIVFVRDRTTQWARTV